MSYEYYTRMIYEWLTSNRIAEKIDLLLDYVSNINFYIPHIAFYCFVLVLLYVGYKFLRIRSRTL